MGEVDQNLDQKSVVFQLNFGNDDQGRHFLDFTLFQRKIRKSIKVRTAYLLRKNLDSVTL